MPYQRHLYSRQYEEVFFVIGECTISGITILDHKKSFLCHCWMNHHRHPHYWPNADVFFAISKSVVGLTIPYHMKKFLRLQWISHHHHHHWRSCEEVSLVIGECAIIRTILLDQMKLSSPPVDFPSSSPPLKSTWRSFLSHRWMCHHQHHHSWLFEEVSSP